MNGVTEGIRKILNSDISREMLNLTFMSNVNSLSTLEDIILIKLIKPIVLKDMNILNGHTIFLNSEDFIVKYTDNVNTVFEVPKTLTDNKSILNVLSVLDYSATELIPPSSTSLLATANDILEAQTVDITTSTDVDLIGDNIIHLKSGNLVSRLVFKVEIENDLFLNNFSIHSYEDIGKLFTLACKSYIYRTLKIKFNQGVLYNGMELTSLSEELERYSESEQEYQVYKRETFEKVMYMNDEHKYHRFIKALIY